MGFLSKLFGNETTKTTDSHKVSALEAVRPHYEPQPINKEMVLSDLDKVAQEAVSAYYCEVNKDMVWFDRPTEERYKSYFSMSLVELQKAAENRDPVAQYVLGDYYAEHDQMQEAVKWFRMSADNGNPEGQYYYGASLVYGWAGEKDGEKAMPYLRKAAMGGLCYEASEIMAQWLADQIESPNGYDYIEENVHWLANLAYGAQGTEDEWLYNVRASAACALVTVLGFETLWSIGMEHIKDPNFKEYSKLERMSLMAYHFERAARRTNQVPEDAKADMSDLLRMVGEIAQELERPYATNVLRVSAEMGSDYAAALSAKPLLKEAVMRKATPEERQNSFFFQSLKGRIDRVIADDSRPREQAHALLALSNLYQLGGGVEKNATTAYRCLERAANMKFPFASHMMQIYEKMPNGEYRMKH